MYFDFNSLSKLISSETMPFIANMLMENIAKLPSTTALLNI